MKKVKCLLAFACFLVEKKFRSDPVFDVWPSEAEEAKAAKRWLRWFNVEPMIG